MAILLSINPSHCCLTFRTNPKGPFFARIHEKSEELRCGDGMRLAVHCETGEIGFRSTLRIDFCWSESNVKWMHQNVKCIRIGKRVAELKMKPNIWPTQPVSPVYLFVFLNIFEHIAMRIVVGVAAVVVFIFNMCVSLVCAFFWLCAASKCPFDRPSTRAHIVTHIRTHASTPRRQAIVFRSMQAIKQSRASNWFIDFY